MEIILDRPDQLRLRGDYIVFKPNISEEEFWAIANEDSSVELIDGVLVIHSPASTEHEDIFRYLSTLLSFYLDETKQGKVFGSRLVMRLSETWNPEPDLMVILSNHVSRIQETRVEGPADLVIEILSKSTKEFDLTKKIPHYLESGVEEIWIIAPEKRTITLQWKDAKQEYLDPNATERITSRILPGFAPKILWIWNREKYPVNEAIKSLKKR